MPSSRIRLRWAAGILLTLAVLGSVAFYARFGAAPADFPSGTIVTIAHGASAIAATRDLEQAGIVRSAQVLQLTLLLSGNENGIQAGSYLFTSPQHVIKVAERLVRGEYGFPVSRITFPEGMTTREMAVRVAEHLPLTRAGEFATLARPFEGYLFPDTYLFGQGSDADTVIETMRKTFEAKTAPLLPAIAASGHTLAETVIVASLIEKEARTPANRRIVAGILWKRLAIGMPLQVDAVFGYIFDRDTYSPSYDDLKVDSPYNTYTHRGLPPTPINNPGLDALDAAVHPTETDYLFYLTGKDNLMHYAKTYAGHQANERAYLK